VSGEPPAREARVYSADGLAREARVYSADGRPAKRASSWQTVGREARV